MLLKEAEEILKKNGYTLSEDAYTDAMDAEDDEVLRKLRNKYAKTDAEYTPDYVPKLDKILLNLDFVKLHKQVHEHDLSYMGFIKGTKYLLGFMIDDDLVITCNVIDADKRKVQKVTMDIAIDSDNYDREYINVNEFIENSDSYLANIKKVVENVKKIDRSSKTKLGRIANGITKALGNDFDTRYSGLRDIGEAVKLLKKNGYRLVEDTEDSEGMSLRDKLAMAKKFNAGPAPAKPAIKWTGAKFYNAIVDAVKARGLKAKRDLNYIIVHGVAEFAIDGGDDLMYRGTEDVGRILVYVNNDPQDCEVFNFDMQDLESCIEEIADFICNYEE